MWFDLFHIYGTKRGDYFIMKKRIIYTIIGIIGLILLFFVGRAVSTYLYGDYSKDDVVVDVDVEEQELVPAEAAMTEEEINEFLDAVKTDSTETEQMNEEVEDVEAEKVIEEVVEENPIDFEALWEVNEDVYAWITIPGTDIDYPIVRHPTDNAYYLHHNLDGSYGYPACIYTEDFNTTDFTDNNTVIYGHNMGNGTMFAGLHAFESKDFFDENREVIIYMPDQILHYRIFATHMYDDRHLMYSFDFSNEDVYASFLQDIFDIRDMSANIDTDMEVSADDNIITLATCVSGMPNNRYLVHAVLQK